MFRELLSLWRQEDLLKQAFETAGQMLVVTREMYDEVIRCTLQGTQSQFDVHQRDKDLNVMEKEIRRKILEHLSINPQQDVASSLVLASVVNDIERIGDYAKNVEELMELAPVGLDSLKQSQELKSSSERILGFFDLTREAFLAGDKDKASIVMKEHREVRKVCDNAIRGALESGSVDKAGAVVMVLFSRYLKRTSAHLKNIASSVVQPFDDIGYTKPPKISDE